MPEHERGIPRQDKTQEESALPQGRGETLIAHPDRAVTRTTPRPTIQQQYNDQLGIYVQEKTEQIDRLQKRRPRSMGATSCATETRIAQVAQRLDRVGEIEEADGVYAEMKIEELAERKLRLIIRSSPSRGIRSNAENHAASIPRREPRPKPHAISHARKRMTRMKSIALIDTRSEVPGVSLGILVSTHPDVMAAFAANDAFQKAEASGRHIRTKIVTLKDRLDVGQPVQPAHLAESK